MSTRGPRVHRSSVRIRSGSVGVETLRGTIDVEFHLHAGSKTRTNRVGGPNGGRAHEGMKHAHRVQPALQVVEIQGVGKQALGSNGTVNKIKRENLDKPKGIILPLIRGVVSPVPSPSKFCPFRL
jgi:hypothetical protein